ncbi:unnamed protein product [Choristocarpus tenellus]
MGAKLFPDGVTPTREVIIDQIMLAQMSTIVYAGLPVLGEFFIEEGYTRCCASILRFRFISQHTTFPKGTQPLWHTGCEPMGRHPDFS